MPSLAVLYFAVAAVLFCGVLLAIYMSGPGDDDNDY